MQYEDENGVNEPSRRRLLKGIGALALAGSCPVAHAQKTQSAPGTLSPDARNEKQPFYGEHQAGILTPQQAAMMLVAFDVLASDKADLERLFRLLTLRLGGIALSSDPMINEYEYKAGYISEYIEKTMATPVGPIQDFII